jgi:hypothetical protein
MTGGIDMNTMTIDPAGGAPGARRAALMRRLAKAGFWFFLAKGLLWLVAPFLAFQFVG